jgi:hypothetical protein
LSAASAEGGPLLSLIASASRSRIIFPDPELYFNKDLCRSIARQTQIPLHKFALHSLAEWKLLAKKTGKRAVLSFAIEFLANASGGADPQAHSLNHTGT